MLLPRADRALTDRCRAPFRLRPSVSRINLFYRALRTVVKCRSKGRRITAIIASISEKARAHWYGRSSSARFASCPDLFRASTSSSHGQDVDGRDKHGHDEQPLNFTRLHASMPDEAPCRAQRMLAHKECRLCPGSKQTASASITSSRERGHRWCCCTRWAARSTAGMESFPP